MRPVLIIHFSRRRSILSHGQKVCTCVRDDFCVYVSVKGCKTVMGRDVASCNALNREEDLCPISNLCESEVGQVLFQCMYFWVCATGKPYQCGECTCDFMFVVLGQILCVYATSESTAFVSDFHRRLFFLLSFTLYCCFHCGFFETCSVFHYQWKKWGEWLKKVSPISINTQLLVENESKLQK